jgi:hypothetical protein
MQQTTTIEAKCRPIREGSSSPAMQVMFAFPEPTNAREKIEIRWPPKSGWMMVVVAERWIELDETEAEGIR